MKPRKLPKSVRPEEFRKLENITLVFQNDTFINPLY